MQRFDIHEKLYQSIPEAMKNRYSRGNYHYNFKYPRPPLRIELLPAKSLPDVTHFDFFVEINF